MQGKGFRLGIFGTSGAGKTYHFKNVILPALKGKVIFLFDGDNALYGERFAVESEYFKNCNELFSYCVAQKKLVPQLYVIGVERPGDIANGLSFINELQTECVTAIDELPYAIAGAKPVVKQSIRDGIFKIARAGRKRGMSLALITQRPGDIETDVRSVLSSIICFKLTLENDIDAIKRCGLGDPGNTVAFDVGEFTYLGESILNFNKTGK